MPALKNGSQQTQRRLSLKTVINELDLLNKAVIILWNIWKKRFVIAFKQINRKKLILVMPRSIIILILREKTQNH